MNPLVFDMTRLIGRSRFVTPTGIDRFELHYARWVRSRHNPQDLFIETTRHGPAIVKRERADEIIDHVRRRWLDRDISVEQAARLEAVFAAIRGERRMPAASPVASQRVVSRTEALYARAIGAMRAVTTLRIRLPRDTTFVHVSHTRLDRPRAFEWLGSTPRRGLFYVHDLIPLSHPEFVRATEPIRHIGRMETVLRFARLAICNSRVTAAAFCDFARSRGVEAPRVAIVPPGVDEAFLRPARGRIGDPGRPYFVCVGTIEPRKNHALLLNLWRRLRERGGAGVPRLVIVGKRGWDHVDLFKRLDRTELPQGSVIEVGDLNDAALATLVAGAAALLAPSFTEGYGMQVVEALALGTPVIASDIPAHREITAGAATLIDPLDGPAWIAAIDAHVAVRRRVPQGRRVQRSWADHFRAVEAWAAGGGEAWSPVETSRLPSASAEVIPLFARGHRPRGGPGLALDPTWFSGGRSGRPD